MTSLTEKISTNEINHNSEQYEFDNRETPETTDNHDNQDQFEENGVHEDSVEENNDNKITNGCSSDDALINTSPSTVTSDNQPEKEVKEITVNPDNEEQRSKKLFNSKLKYSSVPYQRAPYYINDHAYGSVPFYYYQQQQSLPSPMDKPSSLMFLSTQTSTSSTSSSTRDNPAPVSPQNLPPRLRQTSTTENDANAPPTSASQSTPSPSATTTTTHTNGRRQRSLLPRTNNSFLPHPPPLMATPPGVLYPYPPAVHPSGPIAYSIRPPDELELLAFQQQMLNLPPGTMLWPPPPPGHPHFAPYPISGLVPPPSPAFFPNQTSIPDQQANSFLNPEAAEWIPPTIENETPSNDQILIDDEINFPPLNSATTNHPTTRKDSHEETFEQQQPIDHSSEVPSTTTDEQSEVSIDNSNISNSKIESSITPSSSSLSSSQDDHNTKPLASSPVKITPLNYSTILSQTIENNRSHKTNSIQQRSQQTTNHTHNQLPQRDRTTKQQQKSQVNSSLTSDSNPRRRQPFNNPNRINNRNPLTSESTPDSKQQLATSEVADDWIEVKSKKTKKFDRVTNDTANEKCPSNEQITQSSSSTLSLTSTGENTTPTTFTSEDDLDEKDSQVGRIVTNTTTSTDYSRSLIDAIHRRLDKNERLLIIMRGCPGSGKSTLAKLLNNGHNGVVLSADDHFTDPILNTYTFDSTRLDDAHRSTSQRASDAFKRNLSPIIIDNTNTQAWEMKPYVAMGKEAGYEILFVEPQTPWRHKARELFKRNTHNLPIRRIKDMLSRFEHDLTVQNLLDQISANSKSISPPSSSSPPSIEQNHTPDQENLDSTHLPKKSYELVDDSSILNDVRLCINDMILFLTSSFYQTTRSPSAQSPTTSLSVSFHDLSLISPTSSSIPSTPTTPHARFPRTLTRFPPTNQDHSFNPEHLLRLPTSAFTRPMETNHSTPVLAVQPNLIEKKRKKNKTKQPTNDLLLNVNNNNNNNCIVGGIATEQTYQVLLPEDCLDFVVVDELNDNDSMSNAPSTSLSSSQKQLINPKSSELLNILHSELIKPSYAPSLSTKHIGIQCSANDFNCPLNDSDFILIGHFSNEIIQKSLPIRPGFSECGIQVDLTENNLESLIETYSNRLSTDMIEQFYEICHLDYSWACSQIDEYLLTDVHHAQQQQHSQFKPIPTLQQLTLEKLNQWNEQIKSTDPSFHTHSMDDLLDDVNDEEVFENLHSNQIHIPWTLINSLEEIYGELPNKSLLASNEQGLLLPCDDQLTVDLYQALQRFLMKTNEPVRKTNETNPRWKSPPMENQVKFSTTPSLRQIMNEEQQALLSQKGQQKQQLDYATEHKLKELQRHFSSLNHELLLDIFRENEYDYDLTYVCLSTMFDENISLSTEPKTFSSNKTTSLRHSNSIEPVVDSYENLRRDALRHAQKRTEFYTKAQQAYGHGMSGVTSYYIHCANEQTELMKNANRTACERLSRWRLKEFYQTQKLDLHGLHADEALNLFKQIEGELNEKNRRTTPKTIEIITGYGKNSMYGGGYGKIRAVISTYLQQRNYRYSEANKGVLLLQL